MPARNWATLSVHEYCLSNLTRTGAAPVTTYPRQQSCGQPGSIADSRRANACLPARAPCQTSARRARRHPWWRSRSPGAPRAEQSEEPWPLPSVTALLAGEHGVWQKASRVSQGVGRTARRRCKQQAARLQMNAKLARPATQISIQVHCRYDATSTSTVPFACIGFGHGSFLHFGRKTERERT